MAQEIERKFLVKGDFMPEVTKSTRIVQGYLSSVPERTVRVRIKGEKAFLTIKGIGNESGASRFEWEKEISIEDARLLQKSWTWAKLIETNNLGHRRILYDKHVIREVLGFIASK